MDSFCECGNESLGSKKCRKTVEWLHNLSPLKYCRAPQSGLVGWADGRWVGSGNKTEEK
jgi:hypothetical protein